MNNMQIERISLGKGVVQSFIVDKDINRTSRNKQDKDYLLMIAYNRYVYDTLFNAWRASDKTLTNDDIARLIKDGYQLKGRHEAVISPFWHWKMDREIDEQAKIHDEKLNNLRKFGYSSSYFY